MIRRRFIQALAAVLLALAVVCAAPASAQKKSKSQKNQPQPTTGTVNGRVRVDTGMSAAGVTVLLRHGDEEVARTTTDAKGDFEFQSVAPGGYGLTFRKPGLQVGRLEDVEVRAGRSVSLKDHLFLPVDEGSIAFVKGSVFDAAGRSLPNARVEIARVGADGSLKKLDSRVTNGYGEFSFRLQPEAARYRLTAKADGMEAATQEVEVEGAAIYRAALSLKPARK